jgi:hypothetical protein
LSLDQFNEVPSDNLNKTDGKSLAAEKQAVKDSQDLECLRELKKSVWFRVYYERRLREEREALVKAITSDASPEVLVPSQRAVISFIDKLVAMPENDRQIKWKNLNPNTPIPED